MSRAPQPDLFAAAPAALPEGLAYRPDLLTAEEERAVVAELQALDFRPFEFHGWEGKRRTVSFGWRYDFNDQRLSRAPDMPPFLLPLRDRAAALAGLPAEGFEHVLLTEYAPGAGIGWHRDRPQFDEVIGFSLLSPCRFRLRRRDGARWARAAFTAEPRSAYLLTGPARWEWEHSIPPLETLRYSVTFRKLRAR